MGTIDAEHPDNHDLLQGSWRLENSFFDLENGTRHNNNVSQKNVVAEFKNYFMAPIGEVSWECRHIA